MRDPKTHAKVLAVRRRATGRAVKQAHYRTHRWGRLMVLKRRLKATQKRHARATGWSYEWLTTGEGLWRHGTEIIPDTEEEA